MTDDEDGDDYDDDQILAQLKQIALHKIKRF
jgi:hypothetical protein